MKFRQNCLLYWEGQVVVFFCLIGWIVLMIYDKIFILILLIPSILLVGVFIIIQLLFGKEYIIINEKGITCQKGENLHWEYRWSEIAKLQIGTRFRNPSVEIVLKTTCSDDNSKIETYFQLGLTAKKALKTYCKCPLTNKTD